ncbi:unnamed protein product [Cuscuta europaea]|uniref:CASP-like protein n=1 Tax=Cuscuta europaea TaxID=41803 RepID=A0A9P0ZTE6_CUSEU|nr:unnamed protein product [Cuscuta europaea]
MSYLGLGVSPRNVPVYHGSSLKVFDKRVRLAELVLRCVICALALITALLIATDTQVQEIFTIQKKATFKDMKALVFLVVSNIWDISCLLTCSGCEVHSEYHQGKCSLQQAPSLGCFFW